MSKYEIVCDRRVIGYLIKNGPNRLYELDLNTDLEEIEDWTFTTFREASTSLRASGLGLRNMNLDLRRS